MNEQQLEQLGQTVDKIDNYLSLQEVPMPPNMLIESAVQGLKEVRETLLQVYFDGGGEDVWPLGHPPMEKE